MANTSKITAKEAKRLARDAEMRALYNAIKEAANNGEFQYLATSLSNEAREKLKNEGYHFLDRDDGTLIRWSM